MADERKIFFIFPGQGSQYRGMGSDIFNDFPAAREVYYRAKSVLGYDVYRLSVEDPDGQLDETRYTQPALLTHAIACLTAFQELSGNLITPFASAGHSLGEYAALVVGGALDLDDALRLVDRRAHVMGEFGAGRMIAVSLDRDTVRPIAERHFCGIGGCNLPDQTVIGGLPADLEAVKQEITERFKAVRPLDLRTGGAFHTYLMIRAAEAFRPALSEATIRLPTINVLSNFTGAYHERDVKTIAANLFFQLFHPVRWIWGLRHVIEDGVDTVIEFGGGLGKSDGPAEKRPNLEGITKKAFRAAGRTLDYYPAINSATIRATAEAFAD